MRKTLLMAPEMFTSNGGIPRILRLYLKALCDIAQQRKDGRVRLVALNDSTIDSPEMRRYSNERLEAWEICNGHRMDFISAVFQHGRSAHHAICGHIAQLPVIHALSLFRRNLTYDLVAHGIEVWKKPTLLERLALGRVRRVICVSDYTRKKLLSLCPIPEQKMVVLPNGLDPYFNISDTPAVPSLPPSIVTISRLTKADSYKGVDTLIQAMPAVRQAIPGVKLKIIGQGDDALRLRHHANRLGLEQGVELLGFLKDKELQVRLRECSLFALPSKNEGFGLVFLEAMAHGRPCLGANAGGIPEVISPETGLLVEYGDIPAISAGLIEGLKRTWNTPAILDRARAFSYPRFKDRLAAILPA